MQVKDLKEVIFMCIPIKVERNNEHLISVCSLFYNGECMLPKPIMEMEVKGISLYPVDKELTGLLIAVK